MKWRPTRGLGGHLIQASIPKGRPQFEAGEAGGWFVRGVVTATYVFDDEHDLLISAGVGTSEIQRNAIYCDVLCYGRFTGYLTRCLVLQNLGGVHEGQIWKPRPAKIDIDKGEANPNAVSNPMTMDGDHVIVGFLENNLSLPAIFYGIPHPAGDRGNEDRIPGHRMRLKKADGDPHFEKRKGSFWGVDKDGNYIIDLTRAHKGTIDAAGKEPDPAEDGVSGNYELRLPKASTVTIKIEGGATLTLEDKDGQAKLTLGDGAVRLAVADRLEVLYKDLKTKLDAFDAHVHIYAFGPTLDPNPKIAALEWDDRINSDKAKVPDTDP